MSVQEVWGTVFQRICDGVNALDHRLPFEVVFVDKKQNLPGLQLADLVCHPIGRHLLKPGQENRAYEVVEKKFRRSGCESAAVFDPGPQRQLNRLQRRSACRPYAGPQRLFAG
ncbi:MAG: hypothetical protein DRQ37_04230 [Gammaproteobacteria bacterium]|nr:MAG: hypothetical protein DRQ37_04230 [Gammaproteobacteria bacterium]